MQINTRANRRASEFRAKPFPAERSPSCAKASADDRLGWELGGRLSCGLIGMLKGLGLEP